jgi:enoyl-CoA hydratase
MTDDEVLIRREGRAGRITMNRPKALNALTYPMVERIAAALTMWRADPAIALVVLDGAGDRALCAGGDVLALTATHNEGSAFVRRFWADEYRLNAAIHRFPKPFVAIQDGIVMGGGIGLSSHASHRVVTERSTLAMPETGIGLIPDVGGTWLLGHAPGQLGVYLGLTGERMNGSDAIQTGFSATYVASAKLELLKARLAAADGGPVDEILDEMEDVVPPSPLAAKRELIDRVFAGATVEAILAALLTTTDEFAQRARQALLTKSPRASMLTLRAIRDARRLPNLEAALKVEYRLVVRLFEDGEFNEGVRALLVDKDKTPKWLPLAPADPYFAPLPGGDLTF